MTRTTKALMLAAAMIGVAFLAVFDFIPEEVAQFAPFLLLALFPSAWLGSCNSCPGVGATSREGVR